MLGRHRRPSTTARRSTARRIVPSLFIIGLLCVLAVVWFILTAEKNDLSIVDKAQQLGHNNSSITIRDQVSEKKETTTINDEYDVAALNQQHGSSVDSILEWVCSLATAQQSDRGERLTPIVQMTSFGVSSLVILDKLRRREDGCLQNIPVISIDTLHLFPETYRFLEGVAGGNYFGIPNLHVYRPKGYKSKTDFDSHFGHDLYKTHPEKYSQLTKIEPTQRALEDFRAEVWLTGRRRSQGGERTSLQAFERDDRQQHHHRLKINPLVDWTYEQVWDYIRKHKLPYNPLYDQGYKSIGDVQTTSKVAPDADERSGRFQGLNQTECGMHSRDKKDNEAIPEEQSIPSGRTSGGDYIELTTRAFNGTVLDESASSVFLVFYSPRCGHCRAFEPTFMTVARELKAAKLNVQAARFNVLLQDVPRYAKDLGFRVPGVPALFLIQHQPLRVTKYGSRQRDKESILKWLREHGE